MNTPRRTAAHRLCTALAFSSRSEMIAPALPLVCICSLRRPAMGHVESRSWPSGHMTCETFDVESTSTIR